MTAEPDPPYAPARLLPCDLARCEGMCCHDGAYLEGPEVTALRRLVFQRRADLPHVPDRFVVRGEGGAAKTAVRPHTYADPDFPAHFPRTRCVFALPDARCSLQVLAVADGAHPWAYKPRACWMHPLREGAGAPGSPTRRPLPPPADPAEDWDRAEGYPGYVCFTRCGRHHPDGEDWRKALRGELDRWGSGG